MNEPEISTIKPALTPKEWKEVFARIGPHMVVAERTATQRNVGGFDIRLNAGGGNPDRAVASFTPEQAHAIAALALAYQPFGFHPEVVSSLRNLKRRLGDASLSLSDGTEIPSVLDYVADRIEALSPPSADGSAGGSATRTSGEREKLTEHFTNEDAAELHLIWQKSTDPKVLATLDRIIGKIDAQLQKEKSPSEGGSASR